MCFNQTMRDIIPEEKPLASDGTARWYLEDLLLSYQYKFKYKFFRDINALRPFLSVQIIRMLISIGEDHCWT